MCGVGILDKIVYISCKYLSENYSISDDTIRQWRKRDIGNRIYINNLAYINYDDIPAPTRKKLPSRKEFIALYKGQQSDKLTEQYFRKMEYAYLKGFVKYRDIYRTLVKFDDVTAYAQHHAVWEVILQLHTTQNRRGLRNLWEAYNRFYQNRYAYARMNPCIKKARTEGIPALIVHNYQGRIREISPMADKWILDALSSGKAYSQVHIHQLITELCREYNYQIPCLSWTKQRCRELLPAVNDKRHGNDKNDFAKLPYKGIDRATHPNDQWQLDGWRLPFYMKEFETLTLFNVLDANTGRIVGYHIDYTENTETILKGIENAVNNTKCLPFEILADNHSFNKTKEAKNFKTTVEKIGTQWTISENPRYKSLIERSFKTFGEKFFKEQYGYIGEGIKTKNPDGRTSQELMDQYQKAGMWLTEDQIKLIAVKCVEDYNNALDAQGKSPIMKYNEVKQQHSFTVDHLDCLRLFTRMTKKLIRRGQINIERSGVQFEFQLTRDQYMQLNDKKIAVRYFDFDEIHLFDPQTDNYLGSVPRKQYAHGAKANQTEADTRQYNRHSGLLKGIKTSFKQRQIEIAKAAASVDPEASYAMNARLTPKNIIEEFLTSGKRREEAERLGVNLDTVTNIPTFSEVQTVNSDGKRQRRKDSPFTPKNHIFREITKKYN